MNAVEAIKGLYGLRDDMDQPDGTPENASPIKELTTLLSEKITDVEYMATLNLDMQSILCQVHQLKCFKAAYYLLCLHFLLETDSFSDLFPGFRVVQGIIVIIAKAWQFSCFR